MKLLNEHESLAVAAAKAAMDEKTARKYCRLGKLPSEIQQPHTWRTRHDAFEQVWPQIQSLLEQSPGLEAKTLFEWLQRTYPGRFVDGQLRTLQRRVRIWRATQGPAKEVMFAQTHHPGQLSASDFTDMGELAITIAGHGFAHLLYHFVLTYSNWETVSVCFSESFESLSVGLQNALWKLGGVPPCHRTDRLSAAVVNDLAGRGSFTQRYEALLRHYSLKGSMTQPASGNENGDAEQSHNRFKRALNQRLLMRASRDFASRDEYEAFLQKLCQERNLGRRERFQQELACLGGLPAKRLDSCKTLRVRVSPSSTIHVERNVYSVKSQLIGELVDVRLHCEHLEVWYAQQCVEKHIPRLRGRGHHAINYRHVIDWLVRKPAAFENYRFREDLFPSSRFRMAWDSLQSRGLARPEKLYLRILELAARVGESVVEHALAHLIEHDEPISPEAVERLLSQQQALEAPPACVYVLAPDLSGYDQLLVDYGCGEWQEGLR